MPVQQVIEGDCGCDAQQVIVEQPMQMGYPVEGDCGCGCEVPAGENCGCGGGFSDGTMRFDGPAPVINDPSFLKRMRGWLHR